MLTLRGGEVFISSTAVGPDFIGAIFTANSVPVGGAVFASGNETKKIDQSGRGIGYYSYKDPTTFRNCKFTNDEADAAGGAVESASGRDTFFERTFMGNKASVGGALRLTGAAKISWCVLEEDKSDSKWGSAGAYFGTCLHIHDIAFINNIFPCSYGMYLDFNEANLFTLYPVFHVFVMSLLTVPDRPNTAGRINVCCLPSRRTISVQMAST